MRRQAAGRQAHRPSGPASARLRKRLVSAALFGLSTTWAFCQNGQKPSAVHSVPAPQQQRSAPNVQQRPTPAPPAYNQHQAPVPYSAPSSAHRGFSGQPASQPFESGQRTPYRPAYPQSAYPGIAQNHPPTPGNNNRPGGEHLGSWLQKHQGESPVAQEHSLRSEPGFGRLAPQQQQNLVNRLHQIDQMPPEQRQRTLNRIENMERLSPERREAVRSSAQQLGGMPPDRKRLVQKAFRDLRDMPPEQRGAVMNSPQFAGQFSAQERAIMGNLLTVEPYQPQGQRPNAPQYGK